MQECLDVPGLAEAQRLLGAGVVRHYDLGDVGDEPRFWEMWGQRQGEVLLAIRRPGERVLLETKAFYPAGAYRLPTGGIREGEAVLEAVRRETLEETGLDARVERFLGVLCYRFRRGGRPEVRATYAFLLDGGAVPPRSQDEAERIIGFRELPWGELPAVAGYLEGLPGEWAVWGRFRALEQRFVAEELIRDA